MNKFALDLDGQQLWALPSGAMYWPGKDIYCASDLHLGKSDRIARRAGSMLPPYETRDTLARIEADLGRYPAATVISLGDSFDDLSAAHSLDDEERIWIMRLQAGRRWIWIEGNHDPGTVDLGGTHLAEFRAGPLTFRHIARAGARGEISGHYHPKAQISVRGRRISRACFLYDDSRLILPAFGTYTGGLRWTAPELRGLLASTARAVMVGDPAHVLPVPPA